MSEPAKMKRIAFFGGTFDPVHNGHLKIGRSLVDIFQLDRFFFLPAFHAPHKPDRKPTSAFHRLAMLAIATESDDKLFVSTHELERGEPRYSIDTLGELMQLNNEAKVFFVIGADSWNDIRTWRRWEELLGITSHIVVSRPGYEVGVEHITDSIGKQILDVRGLDAVEIERLECEANAIYITDAVLIDTSGTELRIDLGDGELDRKEDLSPEVAKYIEKYELYN